MLIACAVCEVKRYISTEDPQAIDRFRSKLVITDMNTKGRDRQVARILLDLSDELSCNTINDSADDEVGKRGPSPGCPWEFCRDVKRGILGHVWSR